MSKRTITLYLNDITDAITKIESFTRSMSFEMFKADAKTIDAVIRNLEIIGEAAKNLPEEFRNQYTNVPWTMMVGMRNKVIHEYFGVDITILWKTIEDDIPVLKQELQSVLIK